MDIHPSWSYLWDEFRDDYVLYCLEKYRDKGVEHCLIFCRFDGTVLRIEDNALYLALKKRMLDSGIPIVYERPAVAFDLDAKQMEVIEAYEDFEERRAKWQEVSQEYEWLCQQRKERLAKLREQRNADYR